MIVSKYGKSYDTSDGSEVPHQKTEPSQKPQDSDEAADERLENEGAPVFTAPFEFVDRPKPSWSVLSRRDLNTAIRREKDAGKPDASSARGETQPTSSTTSSGD